MDLGFSYQEFLDITLLELLYMFDLLESRRRESELRHAELRADLHNGPYRRRDEEPWTAHHFGIPIPPRREEDARAWELADNITRMLRQRDSRMIPDWAKGGRKRKKNAATKPGDRKR